MIRLTLHHRCRRRRLDSTIVFSIHVTIYTSCLFVRITREGQLLMIRHFVIVAEDLTDLSHGKKTTWCPVGLSCSAVKSKFSGRFCQKWSIKLFPSQSLGPLSRRGKWQSRKWHWEISSIGCTLRTRDNHDMISLHWLGWNTARCQNRV